MCLYGNFGILVYGFKNKKIAEKPQNDIKLTILSYSLYTSIFYPFVLEINHKALQNQLINF